MAWGAIISAIVGTLAGIGGTIYTEVKSKEANKAKLGVLGARTAAKLGEAEKLEATEGDFLKTALGKGYMENLKNEYRDSLKATTESGLKKGLSDEAKIAGRESLANQYAKGISRLAQVGTQYRGQILGKGLNLREGARNLQYAADMARLDQRKEQAANVATGMASAGQAIGSIAGMYGGEEKQQKSAGTNDGLVPPTTDPTQIYNEELLYEEDDPLYDLKI